MRRGYEESEAPYEMIEEEMENASLEEDSEEEMEIPEVAWAEDIRGIEDQEVREKEIEIAEHIQEREKGLKDKVDSGEISKSEYLDKYESGLRTQKRKATTRCGLESVGITYDHLGDVSEDYDILISGNSEIADRKERVKKVVDTLGEDNAEKLADKMLEEERLSERGHESIMRQVRLHRE